MSEGMAFRGKNQRAIADDVHWRSLHAAADRIETCAIALRVGGADTKAVIGVSCVTVCVVRDAAQLRSAGINSTFSGGM
jgi:hypothetical protein